jgi:predicted aldo/keto reductase-like oxidoreductase
LQKRRLGKTNLQTSIVSFGGTWISDINQPNAINTVKTAFDLGINYFDTARWDGDSEQKIGHALKNVRDQCIIATKTGSRTKTESLDDLKNSLQHLQTDHIDILQLHGIDDEKTLTKALSSDGALQTCKKAQKEKLTNFIGITGHKPQILLKAIQTGEFDTVLVPLNIITRQAEETLLPAAKDLDIGVIAMKTLSAKTSNLITCMYQPSLSLVSNEPELQTLLGQNNDKMVSNLIRYNLSKDITSTLIGARSITEVKTAAKAGINYQKLTTKEQKQFNFNLGNYCRDCASCMPCPEKINIPAILRFNTFYTIYGLKNWARKLYGGLEINAAKCTQCRQCQPKCPHNLSIQDKLKEAHKNLAINSFETDK